MFHEVTIVGYVRAAPEMRYTPEGTAVCTLGVVTSKYVADKGQKPPLGWRKTKTGSGYECSIWWRVTFWGTQADYVNKYVQKGMMVFIKGEMNGLVEEGNVNPRVWFDKDGNAKSSFEVTGREIKHEFADKSDDAEDQKPLPF